MSCEQLICAAFDEQLLAGELGIGSEAVKPDIKEYAGDWAAYTSSARHPPILGIGTGLGSGRPIGSTTDLSLKTSTMSRWGRAAA